MLKGKKKKEFDTVKRVIGKHLMVVDMFLNKVK